MSGKRKRLYYRLTPVFEPEPGVPPQVMNAAIVTCMATGRLLAGGGGGGLALHPDVVDELDGAKHGGGERLILSVAELETIRAGLRAAQQLIQRHRHKMVSAELDAEASAAVDAGILVAYPEKRL